MPRSDFLAGQLEVMVASAARTVTGNSGPVEGFAHSKTIRAQLDVTAAAGTSPTLNVLLEDTLDGTNWNTVGTFAQRVSAGREVINITIPFAMTMRASWTIGGTGGPSFTFSIAVYSE